MTIYREHNSEQNIVLRATDLGRAFKHDSWVLRDVNLELKRGEFAAVLGLSGSGKTTLFNILAGLDRPDLGLVEVNETIGYMMQKDLLLPWKRLMDNISLPLIIRGVARREAEQGVLLHLPAFGLKGLERSWPAQLSGGERQRAALLRTYLHAGTIMLLDEPFAGIDAITRENMQKWLKNIHNELELTILLITHDVEEAINLADTIHVLSSDRPAALHAPINLIDSVVPISGEHNETKCTAGSKFRTRYRQDPGLKQEIRELLYTPLGA